MSTVVQKNDNKENYDNQIKEDKKIEKDDNVLEAEKLKNTANDFFKGVEISYCEFCYDVILHFR